MYHYVRRFAERYGFLHARGYTAHEDVFVQAMEARMATLLEGFEVGTPEQAVEMFFTGLHHMHRNRTPKLVAIVHAVDAAVRSKREDATAGNEGGGR